MLRALKFRPTLMALEDRAVPGSVLTRPDLSAALGSTLALALDLTAAESIAVSSFENQTHANPDQTDSGDHPDSPAAPTNLAPNGNLSPLGQSAPLGVLAADTSLDVQTINLPGKHHGGTPPPPGGDVVELGFLPGSFIQIGSQDPIVFGNDPPTDGVHNVFVGYDGSVYASQGDFYIGSREFAIFGYHFDVQLQAQSDVTGTYDRKTGDASVGLALSVQIMSPDAPNFDNDNCIIPATKLNMTTDAGVPFSQDPNDKTREIGTATDTTFYAPAIPTGACGQVAFIDYATVINNYFGLPSDSGNNTFSLNLSMTPPIGP